MKKANSAEEMLAKLPSNQASAKVRRIKEKVRKRNTATIRLLLSYEPFLKDLEEMRQEACVGKKIKLPVDYFDNEGEYEVIQRGGEKARLLIEKYKIPKNFILALSYYFNYGKVLDKNIPSSNYFFSSNPRPLNLNSNKRVWEVHLVTFAQLDKDELQLAFDDLVFLQKRAFPKSKNFQISKIGLGAIDTALKTEGLLKKRKRISRTNLDDYLLLLESERDLGKISQKEFDSKKRPYLKENPNLVEDSFTSTDVAGILEAHDFIKSPEAVRKTLERLNTERKERFGETPDRTE